MTKSTSYPFGKLTSTHLHRAGACSGQRTLFRRTFPNGFVPSEENFRKAGDAGLSVWWALTAFVKDEKTRTEILRRKNWRRFDGPRPMWSREPMNISYGLAWWSVIQEQARKIERQQTR